MKMNQNVPKHFTSTILLSEVKLLSLKRKSKQIFYPVSWREREIPMPYTFICKHNGQLFCLPPTYFLIWVILWILLHLKMSTMKRFTIFSAYFMNNLVVKTNLKCVCFVKTVCKYCRYSLKLQLGKLLVCISFLWVKSIFSLSG